MLINNNTKLYLIKVHVVNKLKIESCIMKIRI